MAPGGGARLASSSKRNVDPRIPHAIDDVDTRPIHLRRPILVVDDVPANLLAMQVALAPLEREIVTASSGSQALVELLDRDFVLILLDARMPDMDGYETARLIRTRDRTRHVPIIFVTAYDSDDASIRRAYDLGAVDFLFKPVDPPILVAKSRVFITLQEQADEIASARLQHDLEEARRQFENDARRRQMQRDQALRDQLTKLNDVLAEVDRRKDGFLAMLARELRKPLASIRLALEALHDTQDPADLAHAFGVIDRQSGVLARLVEDLLDVARIKADELELRLDLHDLRDLVATALATSQPRIVDRRHRLEVRLPDAPVIVLADDVRIAQVIANLLINSARYTDPGGAIEVSCSAEAGSAVVRIADNGIGIDPALLEAIFEMFVQERVRPDGEGGLGLGLTLARRLVEAHGGTIGAHSAGRGTGSIFELRLPIAPVVEELARQSQ